MISRRLRSRALLSVSTSSASRHRRRGSALYFLFAAAAAAAAVLALRFGCLRVGAAGRRGAIFSSLSFFFFEERYPLFFPTRAFATTRVFFFFPASTCDRLSSSRPSRCSPSASRPLRCAACTCTSAKSGTWTGCIRRSRRPWGVEEEMEEERRRARARARRGCGSRNTSSSKKTKSADRFFGIFPPDCPACQLPEGNVFRPRPENPVDVAFPKFGLVHAKCPSRKGCHVPDLRHCTPSP